VRALLFTGASFVLSIAIQLTMAKYGADIPDGVLLVLWVVPLVPLGYWGWTHDKLLSHRERIRQYFHIHPWTTVIAAVTAVAIVASCIGGAGYTGWKMLKVS
jgi:hypothetical protein